MTDQQHSLNDATNNERGIGNLSQAPATAARSKANERLLVCVGPSPTTVKLLQCGQEMAKAFGCEWLAVAVSSGGETAATDARQQRVEQNLQQAQRLGAETHTLIGLNVADTVLDYARSRQVTKIIVGKTAQPWWRQVLFSTVVDELLERSGSIDVYVIRGEGESDRNTQPLAWRRADGLWKQYAATVLVVAVCGLIGWISHKLGLAEANIVMIFLLGVVFVATRFSRGPAIAAAIANVLVFDFFFVPPQLSFTVHDAQYLLTFAVMLGIGLLISTLTARVHEQLAATQQQERRTDALYRLTQQLSEVYGTEFLIRTAGQRLRDMFPGEIAIFIRSPDGAVAVRFGEGTEIASQPNNVAAATWVATHNQSAGAGTERLTSATALFVPLMGAQRTIGSIGVMPSEPHRLHDPEQRRLLETCASLIALAIERDLSMLEAQEAQLSARTEQLRSTLLSAVSHDLRTPLATITGAASLLTEQGQQLATHKRHELADSIVDEADRLNCLVANLLDLTRLEAGVIQPQRELQPIDEVIGVALRRLERQLREHPVQTRLPDDLPPVPIDEILIQQVLINLLDNARKFAPAGTVIELSAHATSSELFVEIADRGPGITIGEEQRLFDKFYQANRHTRSGTGLGLAICKGVVELHGGHITAANRPDGGAMFRFTLPLTPQQNPPPT